MSKPSQTAAVYDRWLYTLGGGEQVAFAYAESLRDLGYKVTLLTHKAVDLDAATKKMGVNLKGIELMLLPPASSQELSQYSENYDLFINTSYADYFPNRSRVGILSVFFPSQIYINPIEYLKRAFFVPSMRRFFIYPTMFEGFTHDEYAQRRIFKWLGKKSSITFNQNIRHIYLHFYFRAIAFSVIDQMSFWVDDVQVFPVTKKLVTQTNMVAFELTLPPGKRKKLSILLPEGPLSQDVALISLTIPGIRFAFYNLFKTLLPRWEMRLHGGPGITTLSDLMSYDKVITISNFCQKWIRRYWNLSSQILYPPVHVEKFKPLKKKNWIIHVGRFFVSGHNKKQKEMVEVFRNIVDQQPGIDWEFHLVGSVHEGEQHQAYFDEVNHLAEGYNIHFHQNVSFDQLKQLLGQASIYWHATGLDEDVEKDPIVFEHFGITTVEAMASGCVPVVINAGGQPEIVTKESGFVWSTREEFMDATTKLIQNPELRESMATHARERSKFFSREAFDKRFAEIIKRKE